MWINKKKMIIFKQIFEKTSLPFLSQRTEFCIIFIKINRNYFSYNKKNTKYISIER